MTTTKRRNKVPITSTPKANLPRPANTAPLQERVVLLILTIHSPGNHRVVRDKSILTTEADKKRLTISKRLIKAVELELLQTMDGEIRGYVHTMALPSPFKSGTYAVPLELLQTVDNKLQEFAAKRRIAVEELKAAYSEAKARASDDLGPLFRDSDYLSPSDLEAAYRLDWQYLTLAAPDKLRTLDTAIFEREQARLMAQWEEASVDMRDAMRVGLTELVNDLMGRLGNATDGDKRFKPSKLLERFQDFLANFQARNITGDQQLEQLAEQARSILKGVNTFTLTQSDSVKANVQKGFKEVQVALTKLEVEAKGRRRFSFDDE